MTKTYELPPDSEFVRRYKETVTKRRAAASGSPLAEVTEVIVAGKTYAIQEINDPLVTDLGSANSRTLVLQISPHQAPDAMRDTLLHEALHAISNELFLELEERQVHTLAAGLLDVLRRNPKFTRFLLAKEK